MIQRVFLGLQVLLFIPYGVYCLIDPGNLAGAAGVAATTLTGTIELQTMYGGLQVAVGVMCLMGVLSKPLEAVALHALLYIFAGLAVVRVSLAMLHADFSNYTLFAMLFESACLAFLAWHLLIRKGAPG